MQMRARKALGCLVLLTYMAVYAGSAAMIGASLLPILPGWAELLFFVIAGFAWVLPLRPLFVWMNRGG